MPEPSGAWTPVLAGDWGLRQQQLPQVAGWWARLHSQQAAPWNSQWLQIKTRDPSLDCRNFCESVYISYTELLFCEDHVCGRQDATNHGEGRKVLLYKVHSGKQKMVQVTYSLQEAACRGVVHV
jgi:hypothetical protein